MATTTPVKFDSQDTFMLTNEGDKTITFHMPRRKFILQPGQVAFVPFDLVRIYFGDPRSIPGSRRMFEDSSGKGTVTAREKEVDRLKTLYGVYGENIKTEDGKYGKPGEKITLEDVVPKVTIKRPTGLEIFTPAFDRDGTKSSAYGPQTVLDLSNVETLEAIVAKHEAEMMELKKLLQHRKENGPSDEDDVEVDMADMDL